MSAQSPEKVRRILGKAVLALDALVLNPDEVVRDIARNLGLPESCLATPAKVAARRRRRESAKRGWATRRKAMA